MSAANSSSPEFLQAAWNSVDRFVRGGDVQTSLSLYQQLQGCLDGHSGAGPPPSVTAAFPVAMLLQCLGASEPPAPSMTLFVCMLNGAYCLRAVPASQAQSVDRRPTGLAELLNLYLSSLVRHPGLPTAARRQLCLSAACLAILVYDDVTAFAEEINGSVAAGQLSQQLYFLLLSSLMDVITDGRVLLGSVRRATQRRRLQEKLHLVLQPPQQQQQQSAAEAVQGGSHEARRAFLEQVEMADRAIAFLLAGMAGEPQEVAVTFWRDLPNSFLWQSIVGCFVAARGAMAAGSQNAESALPSAVVECVCHMLRCLTVVDDAADALLLSVVPAAIELLRFPATCAGACAVVASALESSTEEVVLNADPSSRVFQLISAAAECLMTVLREGAATDAIPHEASLSACEGISALTQVLLPCAVPEMDPDDDPEDFAFFTEDITMHNAQKASVVAVLRPFLAQCQTVLLQRLLAVTSAEADSLDCIVEHVRGPAQQQRDRGVLQDDDNEDLPPPEDEFQIAFEEIALAAFTTYERLCHLLQELPADAAQLAVGQGKIIAVCASAQASLGVMTSADLTPEAVLTQATLLPVLTCRYARVLSSPDCWPAERASAVVAFLATTLEAAEQARRLASAVPTVTAAVDIVRASAQFLRRHNRQQQQATSPQPLDLLTVTGPLDRLLAAAWRCLQLPGPRPWRWQLAEDIGALLELCGPAVMVPDQLLSLVYRLDGHSQAAILTSCPVVSNDAFVYLLRCLSELTSVEDEAVVETAGRRMGRHAAAMLSPGGQPPSEAVAASYAALLDEWHAQRPGLVGLVGQLSDPLPPGPRAALRATCVFRCATAAAAATTTTDGGPLSSGALSTESLVEMLGGRRLAHSVCTDLAANAGEAAAAQLSDLLRAVLQPDPAYRAAGGQPRLAASVEALAALHAARSAGNEPALLQLFLLAVERFQELAAAQSMSAGEAPAEDTTEENAEESEEGMLAALSAVGFATASAVDLSSSQSPAWLPTFRNSLDTVEAARTLKSVISI